MRRWPGIVVALLLLLSGASQAEPESVPNLVDRGLDRASYVELARQWTEEIEKNGESVRAYVNLGKAHYYTDEFEACLRAARRAAELGPDDPAALTLLAKSLAIHQERAREAQTVLEHCAEVAPDHEPALSMLASIHLRLGELWEAEKVFEKIFERELIARPLQDFAYNLLLGLPDGAVLITNGDNDTFPPLSLQAGMDHRRDVVLINRSLLNLPTYAEAIYERHPHLRPKFDIAGFEPGYVDGKPNFLADALIEQMVEQKKGSVFIAATVNPENLRVGPQRVFEGLCMRTTEKGMAAEDIATLLLERYRLDSCTDWSYAWSLSPAVKSLMRNYVASMARLAGRDDISKETRNRLYDKATAIAEFHDFARLLVNIEAMRGS